MLATAPGLGSRIDADANGMLRVALAAERSPPFDRALGALGELVAAMLADLPTRPFAEPLADVVEEPRAREALCERVGERPADWAAAERVDRPFPADDEAAPPAPALRARAVREGCGSAMKTSSAGRRLRPALQRPGQTGPCAPRRPSGRRSAGRHRVRGRRPRSARRFDDGLGLHLAAPAPASAPAAVAGVLTMPALRRAPVRRRVPSGGTRPPASPAGPAERSAAGCSVVVELDGAGEHRPH